MERVKRRTRRLRKIKSEHEAPDRMETRPLTVLITGRDQLSVW